MKSHRSHGLSYLEILIAVAAIAVMFAFLVPGLKNHEARMRVSESLLSLDAAKRQLVAACEASPEARIHAGELQTQAFEPPRHVVRVLEYADCSAGKLAIGLVMRGADESEVAPVVALFGQRVEESGAFQWECQTIVGATKGVPAHCRKAGLPVGFAPLVAQSN